MPDLTPSDFRWDDYFWRTTVQLEAWRGFQSRRGPYGALDTAAPSDGSVDVTFAPEGRDEAPLRDDEVELVRWAVRHEREMQSALLAALLPKYGELRADYADVIEDERLMPPVRDVGDFRSLIGLHGLNVHQIEKAGIPYVGFEFGCTWDDEHGLGVLMHGTRVVEIGGADTAILLWIARKDAASG